MLNPLQYGLKAAFSQIDQLSHTVTSAGNPITMDMKTMYKMKGVGKEQTIESVIKIFYDEKDGKIEKVEDRWNDELPEGSFKNVSPLNPWSWLHYGESWVWWTWSWTWDTWWWQVCCLLLPSNDHWPALLAT